MIEMTEEMKLWINESVTLNEGFTFEQVSELYNKKEKDLTEIGLARSLGEGSAEFIKMVKAATIGVLKANITAKPTEFEMMILGPYPEKQINRKPMVEMIAFASMDGGNPEIGTLSAWEDFITSKDDVEALESYRTGVTFFEDDRKVEPNIFKLTVQSATEFSNATKTNFMGETYDEKLNNLRAMVPMVNLREAERNLSTMRQSVKGGSSYTNPLSLKRIMVSVVGTGDGVDKNGRPWAMYQVVDDTFQPTVKMKHFGVWVDSSIFNRLLAGEESLLEIYGTIQKSLKDGSVSMSACFVHPLAIKALERKENQGQVDRPEVHIPEEPQIRVMSSADGM